MYPMGIMQRDKCQQGQGGRGTYSAALLKLIVYLCWGGKGVKDVGTGC